MTEHDPWVDSIGERMFFLCLCWIAVYCRQDIESRIVCLLSRKVDCVEAWTYIFYFGQVQMNNRTVNSAQVFAQGFGCLCGIFYL